jgi:hypothetical protein
MTKQEKLLNILVQIEGEEHRLLLDKQVNDLYDKISKKESVAEHYITKNYTQKIIEWFRKNKST